MRLVEHIEKLVPFKAIADAGSFSQAARILRVSQPSLTKTVQILEGALGTPLFIRQHKGIRLTEAGEAMYAFAESVIKGSSVVAEAILHPAGLPSGSLTIATYPPLAASIYPHIVKFFDRENPLLRITMKTHTSTAVLLAWLEAREVDLAIMVSSKRDLRFVDYEFETVAFGFYASPGRAKGEPLTRADLQSSRLVYMGNTFAGANRLLADVMLDVGLADSALLVDSHEIARAFALADAGIAVLPDIIAKPYVAANALRQLSIKGTWARRLGAHQLSAIVYADERERRATKFFIDHLAKSRP